MAPYLRNCPIKPHASKPQMELEWQGRGSLAYVSEESKKNFLSLPAEIHARLQLASAQLDAQNSVVRKFMSCKLAPLEISSAVEQYELARYKVDWPSPTVEKHTIALPSSRKLKNTTTHARIEYKKTKEDYMEYLVAHLSHWELAAWHLQKREDSRVSLTKHAAEGLKERMIESGVPVDSFSLGLKCIGSFRSGFAVPSSDMDLVVITTGVPSFIESELPRLFEQTLISKGFDVYSTKTQPVVLTVREKPAKDASNSMPVYHIHFEKFALKLRTTTLMRCYRACDDRVYEMGVFIKHWAYARQIDTPKNGTLASFCFIFMLLHYLMNVAKPPVIPNLQLSDIGRRNLEWVEGHETLFWDNLEEIARAARRRKLTSNRQSTAELLRGFFTYYSPKEYNPRFHSLKTPKFHWKDDVVSIRTPGRVLKNSKRYNEWFFNNGARCFAFFAIEDPFNPNNNLAKNVSPDSVFLIRAEFERVNRIMNQAYFSPGFGWEWLDSDGYAGEDIFESRLSADYALDDH